MIQNKNQNKVFSQDPLVLESIAEIAQVGAGRTANKLYEMTKQRVDLEVPEAFILAADTEVIADKLRHSGEETIGVFQPFQAYEMEGKFAFLLPRGSSQELLALLGLDWQIGKGGFNSEQKTTLKQVGTILADGFISALGLQLELKFVSGIGKLQEGKLVDIFRSELQAPYGKEDLIVVTIVFTTCHSTQAPTITGEKIIGYYSLFFDQRGMKIVEIAVNKRLNR